MTNLNLNLDLTLTLILVFFSALFLARKFFRITKNCHGMSKCGRCPTPCATKTLSKIKKIKEPNRHLPVI